jgi:hypothetical protein
MTLVLRRRMLSALDNVMMGGLLLLAVLLLALAAVQPVGAAEIIPQVGLTKALDGGDEAKASYGLAVRGDIAPFLKAEIAGSYRKEAVVAGTIDMVQWPVTASLWAHPLPTLYAGGGVGWYHTTLEYAGTALPNTTTEKFGAHLGGGFEIPLVPGVASLDLNGRYVYLGNQTSSLPPRDWKADYWSTTAGIALHF